MGAREIVARSQTPQPQGGGKLHRRELKPHPAPPQGRGQAKGLTFSHKFNRVTARPVARPKKDLVCLASCLGCIQAHTSQPASQGTLLGTLKLWLKVS